jgi:hypothetical protein
MALTPTSSIMAALRKRQAAALEAAAKRVGEKSDDNAPKDTRDLVNSRRVKVDEGAMRAEISYGKGLDDPRAVINHEKTEIRHDDGGAKYLERALASELPKVRAAIQAELKKTLG